MLLKKEYLGEAGVLLDDWFKGGAFGFEDPANEVCGFLFVFSRLVISGDWEL